MALLAFLLEFWRCWLRRDRIAVLIVSIEDAFNAKHFVLGFEIAVDAAAAATAVAQTGARLD